MIDDLKMMLIKYGPYFAINLMAVAIAKMYSNEKATIKSVIRSTISSLAITFLVIKQDAEILDSAKLFFYVFLIGLCSDFIVETLLNIAPEIMKKMIAGWKIK